MLARGIADAVVGEAVTRDFAVKTWVSEKLLNGFRGFRNFSEDELRQELSGHSLNVVADCANLDREEVEDFANDAEAPPKDAVESGILLQQLLARRQAGVAVGVAKDQGVTTLVVYAPRQMADAPLVFDGLPVVVKVVGKISSYRA